MYYEAISGDDATVALIAKHILSGENWPVFFYRQSFMGSLNGVHMVPALYVFGPSVLLVRLNAMAWSLLFPLGLYVLARRLYDESTARVTLLLAAAPPFLLTYYSTVAEPHFETNTFGVVLLLLALGARGRRRRPAGRGCSGVPRVRRGPRAVDEPEDGGGAGADPPAAPAVGPAPARAARGALLAVAGSSSAVFRRGSSI